MEKFLRSLYKKFLKAEKKYFFLDSKKHSTSLKHLKLSDKVLDDFYRNYYKIPFLTFLKNIKQIIYSNNAFDFIVKEASEDWDLYRYLKLLTDEKIIKVSRNGNVLLLKEGIKKIIPQSQTSQEIKDKIAKKLKVKIKDKEPVINLFKKFKNFKVKSKWDQMPISAGSAFYVVEKVLDKLPLNKKFLFVGDDDFISVILTLVEPNIECLVVDADEQLLECIDVLASKFDLKIETRKIDLTKQKSLGEKFTGFLANPVYTEQGIKEFVRFGINQLGKDGGIVFLEVGDEAIGNRFLFLQEFFAKNSLILNELILNKVYYPHIMLYEEDKVILNRLSTFIDKKIIKKSPKLGASLYIFDYLPERPKRIKFKKPFYAYL